MAKPPETQQVGSNKKGTKAAKPRRGNQQTYVVQPGDTLTSIAVRLGTTVDALVETNPQITNPNLVLVGDEIIVPNEETQKPAPPMKSAGTTRKSTNRINVEQNFVPGDVRTSRNVGQDSTPTNDAPSLKLMPTADALNMRSEPTISAPILKRVSKTEELTAMEPDTIVRTRVGVNGQWLRVRDGSGVEGFVAAQFVRVKDDPSFTVVEDNITQDIQNVSEVREDNTARAEGIDVSQWQEEIDWTEVRAAGKYFAFIKATEGNVTDARFTENWKNAKIAGVLRGADCLFKPDIDIKAQADYFIQVIKSTNDDGDLPPALILERMYEGASRILVQTAKEWLDIVEGAFGRKPIIYSSPEFLTEKFLEADGTMPAWVNDYPLWLQQYPEQYIPGMQPSLPRGLSNWTFWQYSPNNARVPGINATLNPNLFNGTENDLLRFASVMSRTEKIRLDFALNDRPVGPDRLSYKKYADAFAQVLSGQYTQTPLTVGIYATWGMGKSFLLGKIKERLEDLQKQSEGKLSFAFIDFNAWVYSGSENLWAGLVTRLYDKIEEHYGQKVMQAYRRKQAKENIKRTLAKSLWLIVGFGIPAVLISLLLQLDVIAQNWISVRDVLLTLSGSSILVNLPAAIKAIRELVNSVVFTRAQELANLSSRKDFRDKIGFMADIQSELRQISKSIQVADEKEKRKTRFVIFVDDLDRCPPEKAVEVLEAIMLLLSDQNTDPFIIFLAMDARVLVKAVEMRYGKVLTESGISGYEFLDKIVQIPFRIPPANDDAIKGYVKSLLFQSEDAEKKAEQAARGEVEKSPEAPAQSGPVTASGNGANPLPVEAQAAQTATQAEVQQEAQPKDERVSVEEPFSQEEKDAFEGFSKSISRNPRRVKRIVNIYRLARILISSDISIQAAIKWVILTEQWPFRIAWVMQKIEDDMQLGRPLSKTSTLASIYEGVKRYVTEEKSHQLALLDEDGEQFDTFIVQEPQLTVDAIHKLWAVTFNLNPAMQSEVLKSAMAVNGKGLAEQPALAS